MKKRTNFYVTIIIIGLVLIGGISLIIFGKGQREKALAEKYQDLPEQNGLNLKKSVENSEAQTAPAVYQTSGGNEQEHDNFFIKGRVNALSDLADKEKVTVVWFSAPWCEVCHAMRPFVGKSFNKFANRVSLKEIDFDSNPHLVRQLGLYGTPDFIVIDKAGNELKRWGGATQSHLEAQLSAISQP